jgi:hypothetical protein
MAWRLLRRHFESFPNQFGHDVVTGLSQLRGVGTFYMGNTSTARGYGWG